MLLSSVRKCFEWVPCFKVSTYWGANESALITGNFCRNFQVCILLQFQHDGFLMLEVVLPHRRPWRTKPFFYWCAVICFRWCPPMVCSLSPNNHDPCGALNSAFSTHFIFSKMRQSLYGSQHLQKPNSWSSSQVSPELTLTHTHLSLRKIFFSSELQGAPLSS